MSYPYCMTLNHLPPHPAWTRLGIAKAILWAISRTNDQFFKWVLTPFVRVTPNLMIGPQLNQRGYEYLKKKYGVNSIVNLRVEADDRDRGIQPDHYLWLPTIDHTSPTVEQLQSAAAFIQQRVSEGDTVYVHCAAGVGRAPLTAAAYLVAEGYSVEQATTLIKSRRPFINQSENQRRRLVQFAEKLVSTVSTVEEKHDG